MSNIPQKSDSDDLFGHLLDYQQTEEYKAEKQRYEDAERAKRRTPEAREAQRKHNRLYKQRYPHAVKLRDQARKYAAQLYAQQNGLCHWCGKPLGDKYEVDHIIPLLRGGTNALSNLCVTHMRCNRKKNAKPIVQLRLF